jgi:hypothetical protein
MFGGLWSFFDEDSRVGIPQGLRNLLCYHFLTGGFEEDTNPIEKTEIVVYSVGMTLHIDPVATALGDDRNPVVNATNVASFSKQPGSIGAK